MEDRIVFNGVEYLNCGVIEDDLGKFIVITPPGKDFSKSFLRLVEQNGKTTYQEVEKNILIKLENRYTTPKHLRTSRY